MSLDYLKSSSCGYRALAIDWRCGYGNRSLARKLGEFYCLYMEARICMNLPSGSRYGMRSYGAAIWSSPWIMGDPLATEANMNQKQILTTRQQISLRLFNSW
jgi:hypothetical protein